MTGWPPKDWRALLALVFSIMGAVVLTVFVWWGVASLLPNEGWTTATELHRAGTLRWVLWVAMGAIAVVLIGLGMAINRRSFNAKWGNNSLGFEGGDEAVQAAVETADAANEKAAEIAAREEGEAR